MMNKYENKVIVVFKEIIGHLNIYFIWPEKWAFRHLGVGKGRGSINFETQNSKQKKLIWSWPICNISS
jgi:hypothetical protein